MAPRLLFPALGTVLSFCLLVTARAEDESTSAANSAEAKQPQQLAPIIHRRSTLPTGWFDKGSTPSSATRTVAQATASDQTTSGQSQTRPAVHLNASGIDSNYSGRSSRRSSVVNRLRSIRRSVILPDDQVAPKPPAEPGTIQLPEMLGSRPVAAGATPQMEQGIQADSAVGADIPAIDGMPSVMKRSDNQEESGVADDLPGQPNGALETAPYDHVGVGQDSDTHDHFAEEFPGGQSLAAPLQEPEDEVSQPAVSLPVTAQPSMAEPVLAEPTPATETVTDPVSLVPGSEHERLADDVPSSEMPSNPHRERVNISSSSPAFREDAPAAVQKPHPPALDVAARSAAASDDVLFSNRSPVLSVQTSGPRTIKVGKAASYTVTVTNSSERAADDVVVKVNIPSWTEVTSNRAVAGTARLEPDESGNSIMTWMIQQMPGKAQEQLHLDIVPRSSHPFDLAVTWMFAPPSSLTQIQVQEPKLQMVVVGPQDILFGETKIYSITISNPGTGDAENVVLTLLPISDGQDPAGVREMGVVKAGARRTIEVELTARQAGRLMVRAQATADGGLQCEGKQDVLVRRANLEVVAAGPPLKYAGTDARFAIRVTNTGDATSRDVTATVSLPMGAKYLSSTDAGAYDASTGQVQWSVGALRPGGVRVLELTCVLMSAGKNRIDARVSAEDRLTATGSVTTEVESLADLKLTVNDPQGAVAVGAEMIYEVRIVNRGTKAARNINVVGYFSEGIEPVGVRGWRADVEVGQVVFDEIPRLAPGQEMVVQVAAQAHRPGDHVFRTELESTDPETKLAIEEWTRFYGEEAEPMRQATHDPSVAPNTASPERLDIRR